MHRPTHRVVRAIAMAATTSFVCAGLVACTEISNDDDPGLHADVAESDEDPPVRTQGRGTPVSPSESHGVLPEPEHEPEVLEPMVAVRFDPERDEALDSVAKDVRLAVPSIDTVAAQVTVVVKLAKDAPTLARPFDAPSADDVFVTWFVVTEVIAGKATVGETIVVQQPLTEGFPKSDGFLRPVPGRAYVLMLDASGQDPDQYVLAGGHKHQHHAFLTERDEGGFAYDRGTPMPLDEIRDARSDR